MNHAIRIMVFAAVLGCAVLWMVLGPARVKQHAVSQEIIAPWVIVAAATFALIMLALTVKQLALAWEPLVVMIMTAVVVTAQQAIVLVHSRDVLLVKSRRLQGARARELIVIHQVIAVTLAAKEIHAELAARLGLVLAQLATQQQALAVIALTCAVTYMVQEHARQLQPYLIAR